jgi:uncharacterized membrane protein
MSYLPRFAWPWVLLLLFTIPWSVYLGARIRSLPPFRKWTAITLRSLILAALIAALAGVELVKTSDRLAVFFLLDQSNSIPEDLRSESVQWVRNLSDTYMDIKDEAGAIAFGGDASIELRVGPSLDLESIQSYVNGEETNIAGALRLAMAAFPEGYMRRVVLLSDGNETLGAALEETKLARAEGIAVDVMPIHTAHRQEVRVREVSAPSQSNADEPFQLRTVVHADGAGAAQLTVYQKAGSQRRLLSNQAVQLDAGDNVFMITQELQNAGFYEYEVSVQAENDGIAENNVGRGFITVQGEPKVLYVEGNPETGSQFEDALREEGLVVQRSAPAFMPASLAQLQSFDGVILSDVAAVDFSVKQLAMFEAMVRDHGIGLVMTGGANSFGAGAYLDTPVERALPVNMDIKQRKILPRGALVTVLHTCEIQGGNVWARDIALAALNVLSAQDLMGALGYLYPSGDNWIFPLQPVGNKKKMAQAIRTGSTNIGDMPAMGPTLELAYKSLVNADAAVKRCVVITDGDPAPPSNALLQKYVDAKISISTVCIGPHGSSDQSMLFRLAKSTGGEYYFVNNPQQLPLIFAKEASVVKRGLFIEDEFTPIFQHDSELLYGLLDNAMPPLKGYVVTSPKESATVPLVSHEDDPVLAHWRYGLGKSVAFTSDVGVRWAEPWLGWEGYKRFWSQTVRWSLRELPSSDFHVETRRENGVGHIRIDAVDAAGGFVNFLRPTGVVTTPDFKRLEVELEQTGPGIYEGRFPVRESGVYMANLQYATDQEGNTASMTPTGLAVDYSQEYEYNTSNLPLLEELAAAGGGRVLNQEDNPFLRDIKASATVTSVWHYFVIFAACLLPFEIFVRRVVIPITYITNAVAWCLRLLPGMKRRIRAPEFRPNAATGHYGAAAKEFTFGDDAPEASFGTVAEPGETFVPPLPTTPTEPKTPGEAGRTEYTRQLLAAKGRAESRLKLGSQEDKNEEDVK